MPNKELKAIADNKTVDRIIIKISDAEWLEKCKKQYSFEQLAAQYGEAIDQYEEVCMKLNAANTANAGIQLLNKELEEKNAKLEAENENYKQAINEIIGATKSKGR